ncbi:hypothetical protein NZK33_11215 [Cyanobium sp. FGCU-6]|jgi:hypothetical protein|nr:hypothetical protein [Cyanobium sp. FGCU6]
MTQGIEPTTPGLSPVGGMGTSSRDILTVAGYGLIAYGLYNIVITLLSGRGGVDVVVNRISQLVALFPVLFLGPALLYAAQPGARRESALRHVLVRWLVLVLALSYLAFIPLSIFTQYNYDRITENVVRRLDATLQKRRAEILKSVAGASTPDQFRSALSQFPEVSAVNINPADSPAQVRDGIAKGINQGIRSQIEQANRDRANRVQFLGALVRTAALGSFVCGLSMMALALRIIPWLEPIGVSISQTGTGLLQGGQRLFRKNPVAPRRPGAIQAFQKGVTNLRSSMQRTLRRRAERRRLKAMAKRSAQRR